MGFVGLGKLGLPCAAALSVAASIEVNGFDTNTEIAKYVDQASIPYLEKDSEHYLSNANINVFTTLDEFLDQTDIIFIAVQTPHEPQFEGTTPVPGEVRDFDYSHLQKISRSIRDYLLKPEQSTRTLTISVISTVLPGTMKSIVIPELEPVINRLKFCYNPFFIAMGTTIPDYLNPEFILIGSENPQSAKKLALFYSEFLTAPAKPMQIESAELAKVAYNTFIGFKIVFANTLGEIVDIRGGDVDEITDALASATSRLMSKKYLSAGMADGGGCHPRDQIAMSWLADDAGLSADIFGWLAKARDKQTERQALLIQKTHLASGLPVVILGKAYKADINLVVGSPALLLSSYLLELKVAHTFFDPFVDELSTLPSAASLFFVATNHSQFKELRLPYGSIAIDPWGMSINNQESVKILRPGRGQE